MTRYQRVLATLFLALTAACASENDEGSAPAVRIPSTSVDDLLKTTIKEKLGAGGFILWIDKDACESCLGIDLEVRALRDRMPELPLIGIVPRADSADVHEYFLSSKVDVQLMQLPDSVWNSIRTLPQGGLLLQLVAPSGRVLVQLTRFAGGPRPLLFEDIRESMALLSSQAPHPGG